MRRLVAATVLVLAMALGLAAPASADGPSSQYSCSYHGNVGPSNGNFWVFKGSHYHGFPGAPHTHTWEHYRRGSDGRYYYQHTTSFACTA